MDNLLGKINDRISTLERVITEQITGIVGRIEELTDAVAFQGAETEKLKKRVESLESEKKAKEEDLQQKIDKLSLYILRENLVFLGIPENRGAEEDTKQVLNAFLIERLKFTEERVKSISESIASPLPRSQAH